MRIMPNDSVRLTMESKLMQRLYRVGRKIFPAISLNHYDLTISSQKKFIWFRVPKAGSRTILYHLRKNDVLFDVDEGFALRYPVNSFDGYFKFAFVRNPWCRLVSCWHNKVIKYNYFQFDDFDHRRMKAFENFVYYVLNIDNIEKCDAHLRSQSALIDLNAIDYIGRMEKFEDDACYIFQRLGLPRKEIFSKNVSNERKSYQEYYSDHLAEKVVQIYQKDIQIFGYQF